MEASLSKRPPVAVTNLVPKIKNLIALGDAAGTRYYREAGVYLNQAESEWHGGGFTEWASEVFERSAPQIRRYMRDANKSRATGPQASLRQSVPQGSGNVAWQAPVQEVVNRLNFRAMAQERQDQEKEDKLQRSLGNQLIDIGYKVLAAKLHPDKPGGSDEAMQRLNEVKRILKGAL